MPYSQVLDIEWERFNALKSFIVEFVSTGNGGSPFFNQTGTQIKENKMVLQLLQLLFHLIQGGFYPAKDLVEVLPTLIQLLDGRDDKVHEIRRRGRAVSARATTSQRRPSRALTSALSTRYPRKSLHPHNGSTPDNPPHTPHAPLPHRWASTKTKSLRSDTTLKRRCTPTRWS